MSAHDSGSDAYRTILAEHRELKTLLSQIDEALTARRATIDEAAALLGRLGDRLVKHFATEEEGGYFSEALTHAPQLISKANQLLAQHPKMCVRAQQMVAALQSGPADGPDWWEQTAERFRAFRDELLKHESRENVLLQEAYGRDLGAHD